MVYDCSVHKADPVENTELLSQLNTRVAAFEENLRSYLGVMEEHQRKYQASLETLSHQIVHMKANDSSLAYQPVFSLPKPNESELYVGRVLSQDGDVLPPVPENFDNTARTAQQTQDQAVTQMEARTEEPADDATGNAHHSKHSRGYDKIIKHQKSKHLPEEERQHPRKKLEEAKMKVKRLKTQRTEMLKRKESQHFISGALAKEFANSMPKSKLHKIIHAAYFNVSVSILIVANTITVGLQSDYAARNPYDETPLVYSIFDKIFTVVFFVELLLRLMADGSAFWLGKHWRWNLFDFVIVSLSVLEEILSLPGVGGDMPNFIVMRILRLARLTRMGRIIRVLKALHELRVIILSILGSLRSLAWVVLLLFLMLFVAGVFITQIVTEHVRVAASNAAEHLELQGENENFFNLVDLYGSVLSSTYTLFMAISGGADWGDMALPLVEEISPSFRLFFACLVVLVIFAFLNIVLGIFVDHAMKSADNDREFAIQEEISSRNQYTVDVEVLFREADQNGDGHISLQEVKQHFNDDRVNAWLHKLEIDADSGMALFQMLDVEGNGVVDISEFVSGCLKLKGLAKSIDVAMIQFELRKAFSELRDRIDVRINVLLQEIHKLKASPSKAASGELLAQPDATEMSTIDPAARKRGLASAWNGCGITVARESVITKESVSYSPSMQQ